MPTATFFGATGGCALAALVKTLEAGITTTALVRSASKLQKLLAGRGVSESTINAHLHIIEGDAKDTGAVKRALLVPNSSPQQISDIIVSGLGSTGKLVFSLTRPVSLDDPTICYDATRTILSALRELQKEGASGKPIFTIVSTTGISTRGRDVPFALVPMYRWMLAVPHKDKTAMEALLQETQGAGAATSPMKGFVVVRASLLVDGKGKGAGNIRVGWEGGKSEGKGPAIGYTIARDDVGSWIFEEIVGNEEREKWMGRMVTLTA